MCGSQIPLLAVAIKFVFVHARSVPVYDISAVHATSQCLVCSICCLSWHVHTMVMIESDLPQEAPMPSRLYKTFQHSIYQNQVLVSCAISSTCMCVQYLRAIEMRGDKKLNFDHV